jgi:outer membrane scaffolding protein for murein synthesis (MipA/OmpV family)
MMARTFVAAALTAIFSCGAAFAQADELAAGVGVGAGVGVTFNHKGSTDYGPQPLSYARRDWQRSLADPLSTTSALQLQSDLAPSVTFQAGPVMNQRQPGNHLDTTRAGALGRGDNGTEFGGFAGLLVNDEVMPGSAIGLNLQGIADGSGSNDGMMFELGADYMTPVSESWLFSARLSSSFAADNAMGPVVGSSGPARSGLDRSGADGGFKDVGLGLGLDYNFTESWNLETSLGYSRFIGDANRRSPADEDGNSSQFFGGVVVNYRF